MPLSRCSICSGMPPTVVAITGTPSAIASSVASGNASERDGQTNTSHRREDLGGRAVAEHREASRGAISPASCVELVVEPGVPVEVCRADVLEAQAGALLEREPGGAEEDVRALRARHGGDAADGERGDIAASLVLSGAGTPFRTVSTGVVPA